MSLSCSSLKSYPYTIALCRTKRPATRRVFGSFPYYHIYGAVKLLMFLLSLGTPTVVMAGFDLVQFCEAVARYRAMTVLVVLPMLVVLMRHKGACFSFRMPDFMY